MFRMKWISWAAVAATFLPVGAGSITTSVGLAGTTVNVTDLTDYRTTGADMAGMVITGTFVGGGTADCVWTTTGAESGSCMAWSQSGSFWLIQTGTTYYNSFQLFVGLGSLLDELHFDGIPGNTVFDRVFGNLEGTIASDLGFDATGTTEWRSVNGSAYYVNQVATLGNAPVGDIFANLVIRFNGGGLPGRDGISAHFRVDTDTIGPRFGGPGEVPEPGTWAMVAGAGFGLAVARRRRRR